MAGDSLSNETTYTDAFKRLQLEQSLRGDFDSNASVVDRAVLGFVDSAREAWSKPAETAMTVGTGLAIGAAVQTGLNNAEMMGGKIGSAARVAKIAAVAIPSALSLNNVLNSQDGAYESGKMVFEMGLYLGAARAGTMAERIPHVGKVFGPRPTSEVPDGLRFQVMGDRVRVQMERDLLYPAQVRLSNGRGFVVNNTADDTVNLINMPLQTRGGSLEYSPHGTTLTNSSGRYSRDLASNRITTQRDGQTFSTTDGKSFEVFRREGPLGSEHVTFRQDGSVSVLQGSYQSGRSWEFGADGRISMRSEPAGKYRISIGSDGNGVYTYTHGTSRGIRGMAGPRSNHSPLTRTETPISLRPDPTGQRAAPPFEVPNVARPDASVTESLLNAREIIRGITRQ